MTRESEKADFIERALSFINWSHPFSRREFILITGSIFVGISALEAKDAEESPLIIMDQANGLVMADPTKCVGCRRCELACTEF
ncbi:MAG: 4Fe-4S ferredoxin, partial [Deltaproteobacteria bacterium]|nr:4Fe-4S ferredoxin [Deltaproteobacteria bacterium]